MTIVVSIAKGENRFFFLIVERAEESAYLFSNCKPKIPELFIPSLVFVFDGFKIYRVTVTHANGKNFA